MKYLYYLSFFGLLLICVFITKIQASCPQPDFPSHGNYTPQQKKYQLGDDVLYNCDEGYALCGIEKRICKSNGLWSDPMPFCDKSVSLSHPSITNAGDIPPSISRIIDGNSSTCFDWHNATGQHLSLRLDKKLVVQIVRLFLRKGGAKKIQIFTGKHNMKLCFDNSIFVDTDRWIEIRCNNNVVADTMKILVVQDRFLSVCEIEIYGRDEYSCDQPPITTIPYGHFEVSRSKATLICDKGFKSEGNRLVCEGNNSWSGAKLRCEEIQCFILSSTGLPGGEWVFPEETKKFSVGTKSELKCLKGYRKTGDPGTVVCQENGTWSRTNAVCQKDRNRSTIIFCSIALLVIFLIVAMLATTIHFVRRQRNKDVVVVYQSDGSVPLSGLDTQYYSSTNYEPLKSRPPEPLIPKQPEPPSTPRPMAKLSTMSRIGNQQPEDWNNTLKRHPVPTNLIFEGMKSSTLYGS